VRSQRIAFVAFLNQVKAQFVVPHAEPTTWEGLPAIRVRVPDSVLRLQRREYYRIQPPVARPLLCSLPDPAQASASSSKAARSSCPKSAGSPSRVK